MPETLRRGARRRRARATSTPRRARWPPLAGERGRSPRARVGAARQPPARRAHAVHLRQRRLRGRRAAHRGRAVGQVLPASPRAARRGADREHERAHRDRERLQLRRGVLAPARGAGAHGRRAVRAHDERALAELPPGGRVGARARRDDGRLHRHEGRGLRGAVRPRVRRRLQTTRRTSRKRTSRSATRCARSPRPRCSRTRARAARKRARERDARHGRAGRRAGRVPATRFGRRSGSRTGWCCSGVVFAGTLADPHAVGARAARIRRVLPALGRGLPVQRPARRRGRPPAPQEAHAARSPRARSRPGTARAGLVVVALGAVAGAWVLGPWFLATAAGVPGAQPRLLARAQARRAGRRHGARQRVRAARHRGRRAACGRIKPDVELSPWLARVHVLPRAPHGVRQAAPGDPPPRTTTPPRGAAACCSPTRPRSSTR